MDKVQPEIETLCTKIKDEGYRRVILLGTPAQMSGPRYRKPLAASGVLVLVPGEKDRELIGEAIAKITQGKLERQTRVWMKDMLNHGISHGAEAFVVTDECLLREMTQWKLGIPLVGADGKVEETFV